MALTAVVEKIPDAKNFIIDFGRSRMALNRSKNCFKKEGCTLAIFVSENELICIIIPSFMTQVSIESSWLTPVTPNDLKLSM